MVEHATFDEESCRYFLREVGERVVPAYPFDYGMEEVYSLILEKYGYGGIADAISLLRDLLEDDDVATGIGDDGDIWRSWRYHWRRRNTDGLNPYIPRIGLFVLPQPTPKDIRQAKADNFLQHLEHDQQYFLEPAKDGRLQTSRDGSAGECSMPDSAMYLQPSQHSNGETSGSSTTRTIYSHQRCRLGLPHFDESIRDSQTAMLLKQRHQSSTASTTSTAPSQQEYSNVTTSIVHSNAVSSHRLSFKIPQSGRGSADQRVDAENTTPQVHTLQQLESISPLFETDHDVWPNTISTASPEPRLPAAAEVSTPRKRIRHSRLSCAGERPSEEDFRCSVRGVLEGQDSYLTSDPRQSVISEATATPGTPECQKKVSNRNASLVDGVFTKRTCTNTNMESVVAEVRESRRSSLFRDWMPQQSRSKRRSLLQGVKSLFGATRGRPSDMPAKHRHTTSFGNQHISTSHRQSHQRVRSNASAAPSMPRTNLGLMLDGACDDHISLSSSGSYFNKPLPLTPNEIVRSLSSRTGSNTHSHTFSFPQDLSTASTASTGISQVSGKEDFRGLARELSQCGNMEPFELSPIQEVDSRYRRQQLHGPKSVVAPASPMSFTTISRRNPFTDDLVLRTPAPYTSVSSHTQHPSTYRSGSGLPASQSEPNLSCRISSPPPPVPLFYDAQGLPQSPPSSSPELPSGKKFNTRGRSHARNDSEKIKKSTKDTITPDVSPKRSQSPMKRILGLRKGTSKDRPQTPSSSPEKSNTPNSNPKRSFKQWTNKFRHGFLTADQEETYREAQMEKHMEDESKTPSRAEPPSTFPISLDPAHQARLQADMELMIVVSANRFLLKEAEGGRLASSTVSDVRRKWEKRNLPQVLEYLYDQATQRELILANFHTLIFHGSVGRDAVGLNSTMHNWGVLAREMSIRTFCAGDSVIRKWLNDVRRVLEILGAPLITFLAYQDLAVKSLARITQKQYQRAERNGANGHSRNASGSGQSGLMPRRDWSATSNYGLIHRRNISDGSRKYNELPAGLEHLNLGPMPSLRCSNSVKSSKRSDAPSTPKHSYSSSAGEIYDNSRGGRLGQMMQQAQPTAPHEHSRLHYATAPTRIPPVPHMPTTTSISTPRRRPEVEGEISLKRGLWSDRQ